MALVIAGLLLVVVLLYLMLGMKVVRKGYHYTIQRFGKLTAVAPPGLTFIVPLFA